MKLTRLKKALPNVQTHHFEERDIKGLTCDSRSVTEGYLFVAISGEEQDGHPFAIDARANGAAAIVVEHKLDLPKDTPQLIVADSREAVARLSAEFNGHPAARLKVVGITGTNGKTTASWMLRAILEAAGEPSGLIGTIRYQAGRRSIPAKNTTPSPIAIHQMLAEMHQAGQTCAVMEVSSHALIQKRVHGIDFDGAVFTNLTDNEHLDYHGTFAAYRNAKTMLFESLSESAFAVLNIEDSSSGYIAQRTRARVMTYGVSREADVRAIVTNPSMSGTRFELYTPTGTVEVAPGFFGNYNVANATAAAAAAMNLGIEIDAIKNGLEQYPGTPGRLEVIDCGQDFSVLVDYAHSADALSNVLTTLRNVTSGRIILVFGCGGQRDKTKRPKMGNIARKYSDYFVITADNSRAEQTENIIADIEEGIDDCDYYTVEPDRTAAIRIAVAQAQPGDVVLIAGKGHETYQVLGNTTIPYDDRKKATEALEELKIGKQKVTVACKGNSQWNRSRSDQFAKQQEAESAAAAGQR
ncbi:MAG: UDP-N-acetylmuramoyl-L-alanyl-D-glutamate--2,6-diaminopimelate ligase [Planctomycetes bacterium]|nr:UDP-N-acetylmuramoyl-L-alanyl-D-glutamate--2,6-diaminopimelate ligase [Planctomycetota bacterium]